MISGPPKILRDNLQMILHTKVGRTVAWDVEVIGDPITDKVWTDGKEAIVEDTDRITIVNADYSSKIAFTKAQRKDTQRYKVRLRGMLRESVISHATYGYFITVPHRERERLGRGVAGVGGAGPA